MRREKGMLTRMYSTKGNNGRAKRRQMLRKLAVGFGACFLVLLVVKITCLGKKRNNSEMMTDDDYIEQNRLLAKIKLDEKHQRYDDLTTEDKTMKKIIEGSVNLVDITIESKKFQRQTDESYSGVTGHFCSIDWSLHKYDPSANPMFRFLVEKSSDCNRPLKVDLREAVKAAKEYDTSHDKGVYRHNMEPKGFVFHESRCGSTLVANSLAAMDPPKNRVYSESQPPLKALKSCGDDGNSCDGNQAVQLFRDVVYLMGRTDDPKEENLFFKIQSIGSNGIPTVQKAFPLVPWIYVYREPVQVMMSHIKDGLKHANCVRQSQRTVRWVKDKLNTMKRIPESLSLEERCAVHLSALCDSAVASLQNSSTGRAVNYDHLPDILMDSIIPDHFNIPLTSDEKYRITKISGTYSKGKGNKRDWKEDSSKKEHDATFEVRSAAETFLSESFHQLEKY